MADLSRRYMRKLIDTIYELQEIVNQEEERANERGRRLAEVTAPAPSPPEIVLPEPTRAGVYWFEDGSAVFPSGYRKFSACHANGKNLRSTNKKLDAVFDSPLDAARALAAIGEGPGAENA